MNKYDFGRLIKALRHELSDFEGNHWSRKKLSQESGISESVIINIEHGKKAHLTAEIVVKLANSLKLTTGERKEFVIAASRVDLNDISRGEKAPLDILDDSVLLLQKHYSPGFIADGFGDVLAANAAFARMYHFQPDTFFNSKKPDILSFNVMRLVFSEEFRPQQQNAVNLDRLQHDVVTVFRRVCLRHRAAAYFSKLLRSLRKYPSFRRQWEVAYLRDDNFTDGVQISLNHPIYGRINFLVGTMTTITSAGDINLYNFIPLDSNTASSFIEMMEDGGADTLRLAKWPEKE